MILSLSLVISWLAEQKNQTHQLLQRLNLKEMGSSGDSSYTVRIDGFIIYSIEMSSS